MWLQMSPEAGAGTFVRIKPLGSDTLSNLLLLFLFHLLLWTDLKRNDYTPDKLTFPQEDPNDPGAGVKESRQSMRLMLWLAWSGATRRGIILILVAKATEEVASAYAPSNQLEEPRLCVDGNQCMQTVLGFLFVTPDAVSNTNQQLLTIFICKGGEGGGGGILKIFFTFICVYIWKWLSTGTISLQNI